MATKICPICNREFTPKTRPRKTIYCSRDCSVIGRKKTKEEDGKKRVDKFIDDLLDMEIVDVLPGRLGAATDNRMTVKGARTWENDCDFVVLAVKRKI